MYKIRKIKFSNHRVLGNLSLDFCDQNSNAVDTVIFAGENGTGKSNILNELYSVASCDVHSVLEVEYEDDNRKISKYLFRLVNNSNGSNLIYVNDNYIGRVKNQYPFHGIFSDVDINFRAKDVNNITSLNLDENKNSLRSSLDLPTQIKQLLVDIQSLDDSEVAQTLRKNPDSKYNSVKNNINERIPRFTRAFNRMFDNLQYKEVKTENNLKKILFEKYGKEISIDNLSSGEKQIVYRGCFLLKDVNSLNGAFVFIDEPEISLHPKWQEKIMDYYKGIFTDENGKQTSQIFVVTHSPFIIHNENRKNDKVIVLTRNDKGEIIVRDKPEYYKCNSIDVIQDAFSINGFSADQPTVYLEGRTDEKYFNKALEVYDYKNVKFRFKWVGHLDDKGQEENTGKDALNKAFQFLLGQNLNIKNVCLFDCDTKRQEREKNNVYIRVIPYYENVKEIKIGIENALVLDDISMESFYETKTFKTDYGEEHTKKEFQKMKLCDSICERDKETLKKVFSNLKGIIDMLIEIFN